MCFIKCHGLTLLNCAATHPGESGFGWDICSEPGLEPGLVTALMFLLGLTGNIACGKSTVARLLQARGAHVIDADLLVRELYAQPEFVRRVESLFAHRVLDGSLVAADGSVDRTALGALVFNDAEALRRLEALVHPAVAALREQKIRELKATAQPPAVVLEAVKLIESGQAASCDVVWWVTCRESVQKERLMHNRGLDEAAATRRLAQQPSPQKKRALLGDVPLVEIENNGSLRELEARVEAEWSKRAPAAKARAASTRDAS
ncbi:MAG TPA: dephospho-CoA kinase [Abditibacteriaceae bacterium]|jgi:dephospho-CoA kinase